MSDDHAPEEAAAQLELTATSSRIQRNSRQMSRTVRWSDRLGEVRCLPDRPVLQSKIKVPESPDPEALTAIRTSSEPRVLERPYAVEDYLEERTPQFFLRNTRRLTKEAGISYYDWEYNILREGGGMADFRPWRAEADPDLSIRTPTGRDLVAQTRAEQHQLLNNTPWQEKFGRPDSKE